LKRAVPLQLTAAVCAALSTFVSIAALAETRHGVRLVGDIRFGDFTHDGTADWLVGKGECFTQREGEDEVKSRCVSLVDGARWSPIWRKNVPRFGRFAPIVVGGKWAIVDVGEPMFIAFDTSRVDVFWEFRMDGEHSAPMIAVGNRVLIVAGGDHVYLIDPAERRPDWDVRLWSPVTLPPVLVEGHAAIATQRDVAVIDLATGRILWRLDGEATALDAVRGDGIYITRRNGKKEQSIRATAVRTGERLWPTDRFIPADAQVLVAEDQIFAFSAGRIAALDRRSGAAAWTAKFEGRPVPLGSDRSVVAVLVHQPQLPQEVHAYDRETGTRKWVIKASARRYEPDGKLVDGVLVLWSGEGAAVGAQQGLVVGIDAATSEVRWKSETSEKIIGLLSVDADFVRIQRERGFTVLRTKTGEEVTRHAAVALAREGRPLSERLRYLVYAVPSVVILLGILVWVRRLLRRRR